MSPRQANLQAPSAARRPIRKGWVGPMLVGSLSVVWLFCLWTYDRQVANRWQEDRDERLEITSQVLAETMERNLLTDVERINTLLAQWVNTAHFPNEYNREQDFIDLARRLGYHQARVLRRSPGGAWDVVAGDRTLPPVPVDGEVAGKAQQSNGVQVGQPAQIDSRSGELLVCTATRTVDNQTLLVEGHLSITPERLTEGLNSAVVPDVERMVWGIRTRTGSEIIQPRAGGLERLGVVREIDVPWFETQLSVLPTRAWFMDEQNLRATIWIIGGLALAMTLTLLVHIEIKNKNLIRMTRGAFDAADLAETILESSEAHAIVATDLAGTIVRANRGTAALTGHRPASLMGKPISVLDHPQAGDQDRFERILVETLEAGRHEDVVMARRADGTLTHLQLTCSIRRDPTGHPIGYVLLAHDVSALLDRTLRLEQVNAELIEQTRLARRANRLVNEFLANMSHELRTPLNAILGYARLIKRKTAGTIDDRQRKNLDHITEAGESLLAMINDLLDLSKIEAGRMPVQCERVDLPGLVRSVFETVRPLAETRHNSLELRGDEEFPAIVSDTQHLRQILMNLVGNAIKFTNHGEIEISLTRGPKPRTFQITVRDTGIGIPEDQLPHIFEAFYQADGTPSRTHGGTGLGLSIVRRLVEHLNGSVRVDSRLGEGTVFVVTLPEDLTNPVSDITPIPIPVTRSTTA